MSELEKIAEKMLKKFKNRYRRQKEQEECEYCFENGLEATMMYCLHYGTTVCVNCWNDENNECFPYKAETIFEDDYDDTEWYTSLKEIFLLYSKKKYKKKLNIYY